MKNKKKILAITGITLLVVFIGLPAILFSIVNWGILPYKKLTPLVEREINKRIDGHFECAKIELTFFETYPHLGIKLVDGTLVSRRTNDSLPPSARDSLLSFAQITATVRPFDYLTKRQLTIGEVILREPRFYGYVDTAGVANWDIYRSEPDQASTDTTAFPTIDLRKVVVEGGHFTYEDMPAAIYGEVEGFSLAVTGSLVDGGNTFDIRTASTGILYDSPSYALKNNLRLELKSAVELRDNYQTITLHNAEMMVDNIPFTADGSVSMLPETKHLGIALEMGLRASDLNDLLHFIPDAYARQIKDIKAKGAVELSGSVNGELGDTIIPTIDLRCRIKDGSLAVKDVKQGIDELAMDASLHINGDDPGKSYLTVDTLKIKGLNSDFNAKGTVAHLLLSPEINATVKGDIDFTRLARDLFNPDTLLLRGNIRTDLEASFRMDDLLAGKYNNVKVRGKLDVDTLIARSEPHDLDVFIRNVRFAVDSTQSASRFIAGDNLLEAALTIDSMNIRYKDGINTVISQLDMTAKTSPVVDTTAVISVTTHIRAEHLRSRLPDSTWVVARKAYLAGGIRPSASDRRTPNLALSITADSLRYFSVPARTGAMLTGSRFTVEALPYRDALRQRISRARQDSTRLTARPDATGWRARRDSLQGNRQAQADTGSGSSSFLRNWEVRGKATFGNARLFSRLFPLPMRMERTEVAFNTNSITFSDALFRAGKSDFTLTGELKDIRRAMLRGGTLTGSLQIRSDYISCNELLQAAGRGAAYAGQHDLADDGGMEIDSMQDTVTVAAADSAEGVFIVPAALDMSLTLAASRIDYQDTEMRNVEGEIVMRNQSINLKKLQMDSNIGQGNITMFYKAADASGATTGIDMRFKGIHVEKLLDLYPAIDTLLPMLRSFEGIVDCDMSLACALDSASSVILPSINTACFLRGKHMVLLDGETFAEISKTLMFKNKEKNVIDSISVDLAIHDNKIEVFPFLLEMDRYRVAVGGTHNLDMSFNYHISVLKSPVPFKLGLDVTGTLDHPKFKITKCKYKNTFDPAKEQDLIAEKTSLRKSLQDLIRRQIVANAPELAQAEP